MVGSGNSCLVSDSMRQRQQHHSQLTPSLFPRKKKMFTIVVVVVGCYKLREHHQMRRRGTHPEYQSGLASYTSPQTLVPFNTLIVRSLLRPPFLFAAKFINFCSHQKRSPVEVISKKFFLLLKLQRKRPLDLFYLFLTSEPCISKLNIICEQKEYTGACAQ